MKKTKVSDETREQAAMICAIAASGGACFDGIETCGYRNIQMHLCLKWCSGDLALLAFDEVLRRLRRNNPEASWTREVDGEAESLVRCGWTP